MSLFNFRKKNTAPRKTPKEEVPTEAIAVTEGGRGAVIQRPHILVRPHITEKASASAEKGAYVFRVSPRASKPEIAQAIRNLYKVTPIKITVVALPRKKIIVKGRLGFRKGGKKAYVFLKKWEKIEIM